jgi:hypothetical protein
MTRWLALWSCLAVASCADDRYGEYPPFPVSGQVLVNGRPAQGAEVFFHLSGYSGERSVLPRGRTDAEGRFSLSTYAADDGAPAGDYRVTVKWPAHRRGPEPGPDRLGGRFARPETSALTAHVEKGSNRLPPFDLRLNLDAVVPDKATVGKGVNRRPLR